MLPAPTPLATSPELSPLDFPADRLYTRGGFWVLPVGERGFRMGAHFQVFPAGCQVFHVEPREVPCRFDAGEMLGFLEGPGWLAPLRLPFSGQLERFNPGVLRSTGGLPQRCLEQGWLVEGTTSTPLEATPQGPLWDAPTARRRISGLVGVPETVSLVQRFQPEAPWWSDLTIGPPGRPFLLARLLPENAGTLRPGWSPGQRFCIQVGPPERELNVEVLDRLRLPEGERLRLRLSDPDARRTGILHLTGRGTVVGWETETGSSANPRGEQAPWLGRPDPQWPWLAVPSFPWSGRSEERTFPDLVGESGPFEQKSQVEPDHVRFHLQTAAITAHGSWRSGAPWWDHLEIRTANESCWTGLTGGKVEAHAV